LGLAVIEIVRDVDMRRVISVGWSLYGLCMFAAIMMWKRQDLGKDWIFGWAGVALSVLLVISGLWSALDVRFARFPLISAILLILLWSSDMCLFYFWRGRYSTDFWIMATTAIAAVLSLRTTWLFR
jgi:hypothetical protein